MEQTVRVVIYTIIIIALVAGLLGTACILGLYVHDEILTYDTVTTSVIDKWIVPHTGLQGYVELENHKVYTIEWFEFSHLELNKDYQMKVYKNHVEIINERWRL